METIRNSVKAIILQNKKILFNKLQDDNGEIFYTLPGGGQHVGECFSDAIKRECMEELGAKISVGDLVLVREYLGTNHEYSYKHPNIHQIEFIFTCKLISLPDYDRATHMDAGQISVEWVDLAQLYRKNIRPSVIKEIFDNDGNIIYPIYAGDVN